MDNNNNNHGGARKGAGRKPKPLAEHLIEKFDKIINEDDVIQSLNKLIKKGDEKAIRIYLNYKYGQPHKTVDVTSGDQPLQDFNLNSLSDKELSILLKAYKRNDGK